MQISLNWLREYVDIPVDVDELARQLTMLGVEIEGIHRPWGELTQIRIGKILSIEPHPDADKLCVCKTDAGGGEPLQIVCGAKNMKPGDLVPTAVVGATLPGGFAIGARKMRGVQSQGMMCSANELNLGGDQSGLLILPEDAPIGADFLAYAGLDDVVFDVEITPNRGDCASMLGVARELAALYGTAVRWPEASIAEDGETADSVSSVTIEAPDLCARYAGRVLDQLQIGPSPLWLAQRLLAVGQRPINNIVDITNYVLMETGHPLHAFDYDLLDEHRIVVRRARDGEQMATIDGELRALTPEMLVIADAKRPVAVAGVMGGQESEVGERTTRVFLESAYFDPISVRRTARALNLPTEAAAHFQRGADPEIVPYAANRAAALMQQLAGARVKPGLIDAYPAPAPRKQIALRYARANRLLGADVPPDEQRNILTQLGFEMIKESAEGCTVQVPTWRHDAAIEADLIEEVARLHNYDNIPTTLPRVAQTEDIFAPRDPAVWRLRHELAGMGLVEMIHWTFTCPEDLARCNLEAPYTDLVTLENPLSENHAAMRTTLIPGLLAATARNINRGAPNVHGFEIGPVFFPDPKSDLALEPLRLGVVLSGHAANKHWSRELEPLDCYDLKGYAEALFESRGVEARFEPDEFGPLQAGQCALIRLADGREAGYMGAVNHAVLKAFEIDQPVCLMELDLDALLSVAPAPAQFQEIPQFPPSLRDMAIVVDQAVEAGALQETARRVGGKLLQTVDIFDVYEGKQIPPGKKSVALSLVFQSAERTLTDKDTQKAWNKILRTLEREFQAELR